VKGRLRAILALARYAGRRESAILELRANDVLLSREQLALALAASGMDERLADHMPQGAIRWRAESDKQGVAHITPIAKDVRDELERYIDANPRIGDVPLFPSVEDDAKPLSRSVSTKWLVRAETLAELPKLTGGIFHPYRRLWATERKHLPDVDVAQAGGWTGTKAMKLAYQGSTPDGLLAAVLNTPTTQAAGA
jgi:integrase